MRIRGNSRLPLKWCIRFFILSSKQTTVLQAILLSQNRPDFQLQWKTLHDQRSLWKQASSSNSIWGRPMQIMLEKLQVVSKPTHYDHRGHPLAAAASLRTQDPDHHISTSKTIFDKPNQNKTTLSLHSCKSLYKQTGITDKGKIEYSRSTM